jgi:hypothetical protein
LNAGFSEVSAEVLRKESQADSVLDIALALATGSPLTMQLTEQGLETTAVDEIETILRKE